MNNTASTLETAEQLLRAAGISITPVADCADTRCPWCRPEQLPVAA